jgi:hypothetical protein
MPGIAAADGGEPNAPLGSFLEAIGSCPLPPTRALGAFNLAAGGSRGGHYSSNRTAPGSGTEFQLPTPSCSWGFCHDSRQNRRC